jgi:hypothetical protein
MQVRRHQAAALVAVLALLATAAAALVPAAPASAALRYPWSTAVTPNVGTSVDNILADTSCVATGFCMAVGHQVPGSVDQTLAEQWNGTTWSVVASPDTGPGLANDLYGVTCTSVTWCVAVGSADTGDALQTLVEQWNGTAWSIVPSPDTDPGQDQPLVDVSCTSATACTAVGSAGTMAGTTVTLVESWDGTAWSIAPSPNTGAGGVSELSSVSCPSGTSCTAVGDYFTGTVSQTLVETWNGSAWSVVVSPDPSVTDADVLSSVSCPTTGTCTAVGHVVVHAVWQTLVESWNGSAWSIVASPGTSPDDFDSLVGISCATVTSCTAVGSSTDGAVTSNLVVQWNGANWYLVPLAPVAGGLDAELAGVSCVGPSACTAAGDTTGTASQTQVLSAPAPPGYWEVASDGGIFAYGSSAFLGSMGGKHLNRPIVGFAATPDGRGYWEVASDGGIFAFGDAGFFGSMGGKALTSPIIAITSTADGQGYWMAASDGGLFAFGDAGFFGSMGGKPLNRTIVGITSTLSGQGYWEVASDGGLFAFGDAGFYGSMGGKPLNAPIVAIAATPDGLGYWEVAPDGGIFAFGDATFLGSMGGKPLNSPIVALG